MLVLKYTVWYTTFFREDHYPRTPTLLTQTLLQSSLMTTSNRRRNGYIEHLR